MSIAKTNQFNDVKLSDPSKKVLRSRQAPVLSVSRFVACPTLLKMALMLGSLFALNAPASAMNNCKLTVDFDHPDTDRHWEVQSKLDGNTCKTVVFENSLDWVQGNDHWLILNKPGVTYQGALSAVLNGYSLIVNAPNNKVLGIHFKAHPTKELEGISVGCAHDFYSCTSTTNINNTDIALNRFSGFRQKPGIRVSASESVAHANTSIYWNSLGGFTGKNGQRVLNKGIQIGEAAWTIVDNAQVKTNWKVPHGTRIEANIITSDKELGYRDPDRISPQDKQSVAMQIYFPTSVENNCIASENGNNGFFNGISTKGSWNNVVGNTVANTWGDGALYMRDGDLNVFAFNQVTNNAQGLWIWSGIGNMFVRNIVANNTSNGSLVDGGQAGQRYTAAPDRPIFTGGPINPPTGNTSNWFAPKANLITQNIFTGDASSGAISHGTGALSAVKTMEYLNWTVKPDGSLSLNVIEDRSIIDTSSVQDGQSYKEVFGRYYRKASLDKVKDHLGRRPKQAWFNQNFYTVDWPTWQSAGYVQEGYEGVYQSQGFTIPQSCKR